MKFLLNNLDHVGRLCLSWPAAVLGSVLTDIATVLLRFAAWIMDFDDIDFDGGGFSEEDL